MHPLQKNINPFLTSTSITEECIIILLAPKSIDIILVSRLLRGFKCSRIGGVSGLMTPPSFLGPSSSSLSLSLLVELTLNEIKPASSSTSSLKASDN